MIDINYYKIAFYEGWMNNAILVDEVNDTKNIYYKERCKIGWSVWACKGSSYDFALTFTA